MKHQVTTIWAGVAILSGIYAINQFNKAFNIERLCQQENDRSECILKPSVVRRSGISRGTVALVVSLLCFNVVRIEMKKPSQ